MKLKTIKLSLALVAASLLGMSCSHMPLDDNIDGDSAWILIDNFEALTLHGWTNLDVQNDTNPRVPKPQISEVRHNSETGNRFMLRKPAADGIVGNRKAIGYKALPSPVSVGETYTFFTRFSVEYFPNNQSFGLINVAASNIPEQHYNSFEPMIRITDKKESDGYQNDGTLMVLSGEKTYRKINNPITGKSAKPLEPGKWYELWFVVNNAAPESGGQRYDVYLRGGEFETQQLVFDDAMFRMARTLPLTYFMSISNTGPIGAPYGNGGVKYDDIYMIAGRALSSPLD